MITEFTPLEQFLKSQLADDCKLGLCYPLYWLSLYSQQGGATPIKYRYIPHTRAIHPSSCCYQLSQKTGAPPACFDVPWGLLQGSLSSTLDLSDCFRFQSL